MYDIIALTNKNFSDILQLVTEDNIWSEVTWKIALSNNQVYGIFSAKGVAPKTLLACIVINQIEDIIEIEQIFVATSMRRQGLAKQLLDFVTKTGLAFSCSQIWLEVRENNIKAINLYKKFGFLQTGRRKNYYSRLTDDGTITSEDALLFSLAL